MLETVDQVIRKAIAVKGYRTLHKYPLWLLFAIEGLYRVKRDGGYNARKSQRLKVTSRKSVEWPKDMLAPVILGIPIGGRILTFLPDKSISLNPEDHKGASPSLAGYASVSAPYDNTYDFLNYTNLYFSNGIAPSVNSSVGSYVARHFSVNEEAREWQLDSVLSSTYIYCSYITNGMKPNCQTVISHHAALPLEEYIHARDARFKFGASSAEYKESFALYLDALDDAIAGQSDLTANGIMDAVAGGTRWSIDQ